MTEAGRLCCIGCQGLSFTVGGADHTVVDDKGRTWTFEDHRHFGPVILRRNGNPKSRQPGSRSRFWRAYEAWRDKQRTITPPAPDR